MIPIDTNNAMKDVFDRLAKENKIEIQKYRPIHFKKISRKATGFEKEKSTRKVNQSSETKRTKNKSSSNATTVNSVYCNQLESLNVTANATTNEKRAESDLNLQNVNASVVESAQIDLNSTKYMFDAQPSTSSAYFNNRNVSTMPRPTPRIGNLLSFQSLSKSSTPLKQTMSFMDRDKSSNRRFYGQFKNTVSNQLKFHSNLC